MADFVKNLGSITGYGSPLWDKGLDVGVKKGTPLSAPAAGTVMFAGKKGGWGNQIVLRDASGNDIQLSHLDAINVNPGDKIIKNQPLGATGNTGRVLKMDGTTPTATELAAGRGGHVDITVKDKTGGYVDPKNIQSLLTTKDVNISKDFNIRVNKSRTAGQSDTAILDYLASQDYNLKQKIDSSRSSFGKNKQGINNDRDLVNFLSVKYSGQAPTVQSVGGPKLPQTGENTYLTNQGANVTPDTIDQYKQAYQKIKDVRNQYIVEASKYDVPKSVVEGMFDRGEYDRLDQWIKDAATVQGAKQEQDSNKGFLGGTKQLINGMFEEWTKLPGVKQASDIAGQSVGGAVGTAGAIIGGLVAAIGKPIVNAAKGKPLTEEWWNSIKENAAKTGQFGAGIGYSGASTTVSGAPLIAIGGAPTLALAAGQAIQGGQTMGTAVENKDIVGGVKAGTELATAGLLGWGASSQLNAGNILGNKQLTAKIQKQSDLLFKAKQLATNQTELTNLYNKAVKPSVTSRRTVPQEAAYNKAVGDVAFDIAKNKEVFKYEGERTGLPQSLADTKEAVYQGKFNVWDKTIKPLLERAGKKLNISLNEKITIDMLDGTKVTQSPVDVLDSVINDKRVARFEPSIIKYAERLKSDYAGAIWAPDELNAEIKVLNNRIKPALRSSDPKIISKALVDQSLVANLRALLDRKITSVEGPGFQQAKNLYGSYLKVEGDIARATNRVNNKPTVGVSDLISGEQLIEGIITMNPAAVARGVVIKGMKAWFKRFNSPDALITKMFSKADQMVPKVSVAPQTITQPSSNVTSVLSGDLAKPGFITPKGLMTGAAAAGGSVLLNQYLQNTKKSESTPAIISEPSATKTTPVVDKIENYIKNIKVNIDSNGQLKKWGNIHAIENNNPGNLKFAGQPNAVKGVGGFAKFTTPEVGFRALIKQIQLDQSRGLTLSKFLAKYSPPTENNYKKYLSFLTNELGIKKEDKISTVDPIDLSKAVARFESQTKIVE